MFSYKKTDGMNLTNYAYLRTEKIDARFHLTSFHFLDSTNAVEREGDTAELVNIESKPNGVIVLFMSI